MEATTNARTTYASAILTRSKPLWAQQGVGQVEQQAERYEAGERIVEDHGPAPSQPLAGVSIANARDEEAESQRQHENIQHAIVPLRHDRRPN